MGVGGWGGGGLGRPGMSGALLDPAPYYALAPHRAQNWLPATFSVPQARHTMLCGGKGWSGATTSCQPSRAREGWGGQARAHPATRPPTHTLTPHTAFVSPVVTRGPHSRGSRCKATTPCQCVSPTARVACARLLPQALQNTAPSGVGEAQVGQVARAGCTANPTRDGTGARPGGWGRGSCHGHTQADARTQAS